MPRERAYAAVDLGAQSGRVALGRFDGERLSFAEVRRFANVPVRIRGRLQWDILRLYADALDGLRAAGPVDSLGVDSWGVDFGLLDREGRLLQNPVHHRDARRAKAFDAALERVSAREIYEQTGIQLLPINSLFELAAMAAERDPVLEVAEMLLLIPDLLHYWLSGVCRCEYTNATTTQCLGVDGGWATGLLERLDVPTRLPAEVVQPGTVLGAVSSDVAEPALADAALVAVATHDTASAVAAIPFRRSGSAYVSAGTWSLVGLETDRPAIDDGTLAANLTNEGGVAGTFRLLRNVTGLWLLHECRRAWAQEGREYGFDELARMAAGAPRLRSLVDPNDPAFLEPGDMPERIRSYCRRTDQPEPEEPAAVVRTILESLALKHSDSVELLRRTVGAAPEEIHLVGGGARNELLCRWTADAAGLPVLAGPVEATAIGNLLVQALALGDVGSLAEGRELVRASFEPTVYEPCDASVWEEARERFAVLATGARDVVEVPT
jgi:rhamnulokinase